MTPAGTTMVYSGPQQTSVHASFVPAATLAAAAAPCAAGQAVTFSLNASPVTGALGSYAIETATTGGSGTATEAAVSTSAWQSGAFVITAAFAGNANCAASSASSGFTVTAPGQAAVGAGTQRWRTREGEFWLPRGADPLNPPSLPTPVRSRW